MKQKKEKKKITASKVLLQFMQLSLFTLMLTSAYLANKEEIDNSIKRLKTTLENKEEIENE